MIATPTGLQTTPNHKKRNAHVEKYSNAFFVRLS